MIKEIQAEEFNSISNKHPYVSFYQTSNWAKLKQFTGWKALYLGYYEKDQLLAYGLFLLKKMPVINYYLALSPRGYLIDYNDFSLIEKFNKELIIYLKSHKVFELIIDPYFPLNKRDIDGNITEDSFDNTGVVNKLIDIGYKHTGYNLYYENLNPRWLFKLNIKNKTYDELLNGFKKEAKRRALKKDIFAINVRELKENEIDIFKSLMNATSKRRGFIDRSLNYYKQMYDALAKDNILKYMVCEMDVAKAKENICNEIAKNEEKIKKLSINPSNNQGAIKEENVTLNSNKKLMEILNNCEKEKGNNVPLSAACVLTYGKEAIMLLAGNDEKYLQHFNSSNIMVAELIKLAKQDNNDYFNFYGITGNFDKNSDSYGLYSYKRQYGGEVVELIGQFEYTVNSFIKKLYDIMLKVYKLTK